MTADSSGFEIAIRPSPAVRALRLAVLGLGVAGFLLAAWLSRGHDEGWILLALGAMMLWAGWRHAGMGLSWGRLQVSAEGRPSWQPEGGTLYPVGVERWFAGERLAWIRLRSADGRRHEVLVGRSGQSEDDWRRLCGWLAWIRRGQGASPT